MRIALLVMVTLFAVTPASAVKPLEATAFSLSVQGSGAMSDALGGIVEGVWKHFLIEQFKPYVEAGKHKAKK